jgi:ribosomal 50S subunit-associated protein YjgA (DUF615 family)
MPENLRGTLTPFQLPPESEAWDELKGPVKEYRKLVSDRHMALTRLGKLEADRRRAVERDRQALARALRDGKPDPGDKSVEKIDTDMANTRRTVEALEIAIAEAEVDLIGVVDEHKDGWVGDVDERIEESTVAYLAAVEQVEATRTTLTEAVALKRFLHTFPDHGYAPGHWPVFGLIAPNGDPFRWDQVVDALRKDAEVARTPARKAEPEAVASGPIREQLHDARGFTEAYRRGELEV